MKKILPLILFLIAGSLYAQKNPSIIPMPAKMAVEEGFFLLNSEKTIGFNNANLEKAAYYFQNELLRQKGITIQQKSNPANILLVLDRKGKSIDSAAYKINVKPNQIVISASHPNGIFYGLITILQMSITSKDNRIPVCEISDTPAYSWRGFMLDESRHFFGKEKVKSILNWMAFYKLNIFHWHLTDEPGWRLEIKKYPKLSLIGGIGDYINPNLPAQFYSQADIREIVAYAAERYIKIVPEIDMPGHATAANLAYPEFSGGGSLSHPEFTFNPGLESTYAYLTNILKETNILFPSGLIHLGGDEVSFGNEKWKTNPDILKIKEREHLKNEVEIERYFMKRMADSVHNLNAKTLLWDEMADADLPQDKTVIFWWRHDKPIQLKTSLSKGYQTVLCPRLPLYFDFVQDSTHKFGRKWTKQYNPIESVYNFNAKSFAQNAKEKSLILGLQANIWTETVDNENRLDYLLFPRIAALAETAWTETENKDFKQFEARLDSHFLLYRNAGLYFYNPNKPLEHPEIPAKTKKPLNYKD